MVAHQAIGVAGEALTLHHFVQDVEEGPAIILVQEEILARVPPGSGMVEGARELQPQRSDHNYPVILSPRSKMDLTPHGGFLCRVSRRFALL